MLLNNKYKKITKLGAGAYGEILAAVDIEK
jgi:hypothetical protein